MGLFDKFKAGLQKTHAKLAHEIKRIVTRSPKLTADTIEELEASLIAADLGMAMTAQILAAVKAAYETQGGAGLDVFAIGSAEVQKSLSTGKNALHKASAGLTVVSIVGVNGTGKTTTSAKLAHLVQSRGETAVLAACDTFRAAAADQLSIWADRAGCEIVKGAPGADPASVAHDACQRALARRIDVVIVDTAGRLHTQTHLMRELEKIRGVIQRLIPGAPHEVLLVLDGTNGQNAIRQAEVFTKSIGCTGVILTKLDGTAKGGVVVAVRQTMNLPVKFVGVGEALDDLQPFDADTFVASLFL
jgi:fused signal recognition particle receptor